MHKEFDDFAQGKSWLIYLHLSTQAIGDTAFHQCCYSQLRNGVKLTSDQTFDSTTSMTTSEISSRYKKRKLDNSIDPSLLLKKEVLMTKKTLETI